MNKIKKVTLLDQIIIKTGPYTILSTVGLANTKKLCGY